MTEIAKILPSDVPPRAGVVAPNAILRSALFGAGKRVGQSVQRAKIASLAGIDIVYTGFLLGQAELDVWHGLLGLPADPYGWREFSSRQFLAQLGRSVGKADRGRLEGAIARLSANSIEVKTVGGTYGGSLVDEFVKTDHGGWWRIHLNPCLSSLFGKNCWTGIDAAARTALTKKPLAQWLHAFYSTHRSPFPIGVGTLLELSGSGTSSLFHFRAALRAALVELQRVTGWGCALIRGDLVEIDKLRGTPAAAQSPSESHSPQDLTPPDAPARRSFEAAKASLGRAPAAPSTSFQAFWDAYHSRKRVNCAQARTTWGRMGLDAEAKEIMEGLERWNKSMDWHANDGQWIPAPDKWLEKKRWLDEPAPFKVSLIKDRAGRAITHEHGNVERDYGANGNF